jgi:hypothetical protein
MSGWKRWLNVTDADHYSFTDLDLLVQQAGAGIPMPLDPARGIRLTRTYVDAFLDQHLRGIPSDCSTAQQPTSQRSPSTRASRSGRTRADSGTVTSLVRKRADRR